MAKIRRPKATAVTENMPLPEKIARFRRRMRSDGTFDHQHPHAKRPKNYRKVHSWKKNATTRKRSANVNSYQCMSFTSKQLEEMYLALWMLMDYFGGNRSLACRVLGIANNTLYGWLKKGYVTPIGADIIGDCDEVPFTREDMRPELTAKAWAQFDAAKAKLYQRREESRQNMKKHRIEPWKDDYGL